MPVVAPIAAIAGLLEVQVPPAVVSPKVAQGDVVQSENVPVMGAGVAGTVFTVTTLVAEALPQLLVRV